MIVILKCMNHSSIVRVVKYFLLVQCFGAILFNSSVAAGIPGVISYQGRLTDASGNPVTDGTQIVRFYLWTHPTSSDGQYLIWQSGFREVAVAKGLFDHPLGDSVALPTVAFKTDTNIYLGVRIGTDPEIAPRSRLASSAFAYHSMYADTAAFASSFPANSVTSTAIVDTSILLGDIAPSGALINQTIVWNGTNWIAASFPTEQDPKIGALSTGTIPKWNGSNMANSAIVDNGNIGVGVPTPSEKLQVQGVIHSTSGGFKFPDGSIQTTAGSGTVIAGVAIILASTDSIRVTSGSITTSSIVCVTPKSDDASMATSNHTHPITIATTPDAGTQSTACWRYGNSTFLTASGAQSPHTVYTEASSTQLQRIWVTVGSGFFTIHSGRPVQNNLAISYIAVP